MRVLLAALCAYVSSPIWGDTGGLQSLPYEINKDKLRASVLANSTFRGGTGWTFGQGHGYDSTISRTSDGSGALRLSGIGSSETSSSTKVTLPDVGRPRILRLQAWLKASGNPGANAQFRMYIVDNQHNGVLSCGAWVSLSGLSSVWREYTLELGATSCAYSHIPDTHINDTLTIYVRGKSIPASVKVWVDDVKLQPVVRDLVIYPTYPNYRGMLWPDQGTTIKWKAIVDPPPGLTTSDLSVQVNIVRAPNTVITSVSDASLAAISQSGPWTSYSVNDMSYNASGLPDGTYYLRGYLKRKSDGSTVYAYPDYKIVKEQPSVQRDKWKTWVDKYNRVVLGGKPSFIWGTYGRFTNGRNLFVPGATGDRSNPDTHRTIANGCNSDQIGEQCYTNVPAITPWNRGYGLSGSTFLKQMADVKMNALTIHAGYGTYNVGFDNTVSGGFAGGGKVASSGTRLTGTGTTFGSQVLTGDAIRVQRKGAGTVRTSGELLIGTGTRFKSEVRPGDVILVGGLSYRALEVSSDTMLMLDGAPSWSNATYNVVQYRRIVSMSGQTGTLDDSFAPDLSSGTAYNYEKCGLARYNPSRDEIAGLLTAAQDHNIWYWHITSNIHGVNTDYWAYTPYMVRCHLVNRDDSAEWLTRFGNKGLKDGFLGYYMSDEPSYANTRVGLTNIMETQQGQQRANMGGVNFWVDGPAPKFSFDQVNNISDALMPDPYPATADYLPTVDDIAWKLSAWNKHGRSYWWPRRSATSVFESRPMIPTIQLWSWYASYGLSTSTYPQLSDMKIQMLSSIAAGASGIMWWHMGSGTRTLGDRMESDYLTFRRAAGVVANLLPILDEPVQDLTGRVDGSADYGRLIASVSDPDIRCSSRKKDDQALLACVNTTNTDKTVTITMAPGISKVTLPWDNSTVTHSGKSFTVTFRGLNGGTQKTGKGNIMASGQLLTCTSSCDFVGQLAARHTITAAGKTRMVISVNSGNQLTLDVDPGSSWNNVPFTYSSDADKEKSVHLFLVNLTT